MTGFWVHSRCYRILQKLQMMCSGVVGSIKCLQLDSCCLLPVLVLGRSWEANPGSGPDLSSRKRKTGCCAPWKVPPSWDQISHIPTHLLGVKLSPRRLFFEIETKYMPHINCQLWVLFTQRLETGRTILSNPVVGLLSGGLAEIVTDRLIRLSVLRFHF